MIAAVLQLKIPTMHDVFNLAIKMIVIILTLLLLCLGGIRSLAVKFSPGDEAGE